MEKLTFTELYNISDILIEQIRNEKKNTIELLTLINELRLVKKAIYKKSKKVLDQIEKRLEIMKGGKNM